jgi:cobalt/nickel transport system permease protein
MRRVITCGHRLDGHREPGYDFPEDRSTKALAGTAAACRAQVVPIADSHMHVPDGYLSPATCAALYAGVAPFWYVALRRLRRALHTRVVPLLSLFAAFSFVVMMFNIPLPGGTTGHAVGVGLAASVVGAWASILAISVALVIQAVFFGDGGITAIGANCFNIAVVGSFVAWGVYTLLSHGAALSSPRRALAAGAGGYVAINASALVTAIEFGAQPLLYHDAAGAPLYSPYPWSIAIPAMMLGHLLVAGVAEFAFSAGVVAFLQRTDPGLLRMASGAVETGIADEQAQRRTVRRLWLAIGLLMLLTPIGILATGTAWGEWSASDFADAAARQQIAAASLGHAPPAQPPQGLAALSTVWTAPWADYAPAFVQSPAIGYVLSAMFGVGAIVLFTLALGGFAGARRDRGIDAGSRT